MHVHAGNDICSVLLSLSNNIESNNEFNEIIEENNCTYLAQWFLPVYQSNFLVDFNTTYVQFSGV